MTTERKNEKLFEKFVEMDGRARLMLGEFYLWLQAPAGAALPDVKASAVAHHADRYLRDFLVDIWESAPEDSSLAPVRSYLGNWYIINTLEPTPEQIGEIARALSLYHDWAAGKGYLPAPEVEAIKSTLADTGFFTARLEAFWALDEKGITGWREVDDYRKLRRLH